jgi:hypothetical protein
MSQATEDKSLTGSGFEKKGGYPSGDKTLSPEAKVPVGPAPGAQHKPGASEDDE